MPSPRQPVLSLILFLAACAQLRYAEVLEPVGRVDRVEIRVDAGVVDIAVGERLRVERGARGPEAALDLSHQIEDGVLVLEARCATLVPCGVDTTLTVPPGVEVAVWMGQGEVWATGLEVLSLDLGEGTVDVEASRRLDARVGAGAVRATLGAEATGRVSVADGDLDVLVPGGPWRVEAEGATVDLKGVDEGEGPGQLELLAPAGAVRVRGA